MEACKLARAIDEYVGGLVALDRGGVPVVARKTRGPAFGIQLRGNTRSTLGAHRGNAGRVDIGNLPTGNRHRKVARIEGRLRRHAFEMPNGNMLQVNAGAVVTIFAAASGRATVTSCILTVARIGLGLIRPIDAALARQDVVQARVGRFANMRVVDDVDASDDERKHRRDGTHGHQNKLAAQATTHCASGIGAPRITRVRTHAELCCHALPPRARARAHAYSPSSTTSSE